MSQYEAIIIGGSAGSFQVIVDVLSSIPKTFNLPIILCFHRLKSERHGFVEALSPHSVLPIIEPNDKTAILGGIVYLAPANYHLYIESNKEFALSTEVPENHSRPSIDLAFFTASKVYKERLIGILLSGANRDGTKGIYAIKENGGFTIVQNPLEAEVNIMPQTAISNVEIDRILNTQEIVSFLNNLM